MRNGQAGRALLTIAFLIAIAVLLPGVRAYAEQQPAMLDVSINKVPQGQAFVVIDDGQVWMDRALLTEAGIRKVRGDEREWNGRTLVRLASLAPGIAYELDEISLTLKLTVQASLMSGKRVDLSSRRPDGIEYHHATSAFLNYGTSVMSVGTSSVSFEGGLSAGAALFTSTGFADSSGAFRRGMTTITFDDPRLMNRYVAGDAIASSGALGGTVQLGGVTMSRDFSLDPYFVRFPTISLSGAVMTPSRVEVYVNNQLVRVEQLPPGVYSLDHLPLPVGAGDTRVVVRDAFGAEQNFNSAYYISQGVLGRGIQQFSYSAGAERLNQFDSSWSYGSPAFVGLHRIGVTDSFTLGGRMEGSSDLVSGGPMATVRLGRAGDVEGIAGISRTSTGTGYATSLAYEYTSRAVGALMALRNYSADYSTLSTKYAIAAPRRDVAASVTSRAGSRTTVGVSWQALDYYGTYPAMKRGAVTTSVTLSRHFSLYVSGNRSFSDGRWFTGGFAGLSVNVGSRDMVSASAERDAGISRQSVDLQRSLPVGTGVGYHVQAMTGGPGTAGTADLDAELRAQTQYGKYAIRQTVFDGQPSTIADASGALVFIGGGVHFTRPVENGYALVQVPEVQGVRTYVSNQEVGRTDRHGNLVVPNLLAYYANRVSIDDTDVPMDRDVPHDAMLLAPPYRGGAIALFPAPRSWRVAGRFVVVRDRTVMTPSNWALVVATPSGPVNSALGNDGAFYVEGVAPGDHRAELSGEGLTCVVTLHVPSSTDPVIRAGVTTCTDVRGVAK